MKSAFFLTGALGALALGLSTAAMAAPAATTPPPAAGADGQHWGPPGMGPGGPGMMGRHHMGRGGRGGWGMMGGPRATPAEMAKRRADMFAKMDANKDGRVTEAEFHAFVEARKREREHQMFQRFSGGQDAVTLDQLNAKALERERAMEGRRGGRGPGGQMGPGGQRGPGGPGGPPPVR